jgi:hypothetical protein
MSGGTVRRADPDETPEGRQTASGEQDADAGDGRHETTNQRMDRNWNEILQELRVTQTGTQILTGFLLTLAFQPKFAQLDGFQRTVYLVLVAAAGLTTALGLAPVLLHRELFRRHMKQVLVRTADLFLRATLAGIAVVLAGTQLLVFDVAVGRRAGLVACAATLVVVALIAALPLWLRAQNRAIVARTGNNEPER